MGGQALDVECVRLDRPRYDQVCSEVLPRLKAHYAIVDVPRVLPTKTSFGDVDILVAHVDDASSRKPIDPRAAFASRSVARNGPVLSFEYGGHQIDLIHVKHAEMDLSRFFFSYPDMGMIVGMIAKTAGLKFGYQGMSLIVHSTQVMLSTDLPQILRFFRLDHAAWERGFDTQQDVFDFIQSSKLYRPSMFRRSRHESEWNHAERQRLAKRPMFVAFVEQANTRLELDALVHSGVRRIVVEEVVDDALAFFDKRSALDMLNEKVERRRLIKQRLNGHIVTELTGLCGTDVGRFLEQCRERVHDDEWLAMTVDDARAAISDCWAELREQYGVSS